MSVVRHLHQQLEYQAVTDPLTGLLNRRGFYQTVENLLLRGERSDSSWVLLYLDLDGFKRVNDSLGHDAGDRVLRWVSEQLKACLRPFDILARMGGDDLLHCGLEFPYHSGEDCREAVERVRSSANRGYGYCPRRSSVRHLSGLRIELDGLLRASDIAMSEPNAPASHIVSMIMK